MSSGDCAGVGLAGMPGCLLRAGAVLSLEPLDAARRVDQLLFSGEEGMAGRADLEADLGLGGPGLELVPAGAADRNDVVLRMNSLFHRTPSRGKPIVYRSGSRHATETWVRCPGIYP